MYYVFNLESHIWLISNGNYMITKNMGDLF